MFGQCVTSTTCTMEILYDDLIYSYVRNTRFREADHLGKKDPAHIRWAITFIYIIYIIQFVNAAHFKIHDY